MKMTPPTFPHINDCWVVDHERPMIDAPIGKCVDVIDAVTSVDFNRNYCAAVLDGYCLPCSGTFFELFASAANRYSLSKDRDDFFQMLGLMLSEYCHGYRDWAVLQFKNPYTHADEYAIYDGYRYGETYIKRKILAAF